MKSIMIYDIEAEEIEKLENKLDISAAEIIEYFIENFEEYLINMYTHE